MSMVLQIVIAAALISIAAYLLVTRFKIRVRLPEGESPAASSDANPPLMPAKSEHKTDTHSGHGSGHHHHEKKSSGWLSAIMWILFVVILVAALRFFIIPTLQGWGFGQIPGTSSERRYELSQTQGAGARSSSGSGVCPAASDEEWHTMPAPAHSGDWTTWVEIPRCHTIVWCVPGESNVCQTREVMQVDLQCRLDGMGVDWAPESCLTTTAGRARSKTETPATTLVYKLQFTG